MKKNFEIKVSREDNKNNKFELLFCIIIGIIFMGLVVLSIKNDIFISAMMIMGCLELFSIGYCLRDDKNKKYIVYSLFVIGILLLIGAIIYVLVRTV